LRLLDKLLIASLILPPIVAAAQPSADTGLLQPGVWQSDAYGYVFEGTGQRVQVYDVSAAGCVRGASYPRRAFRDLYGIAAPSTSTDSVLLVRTPTRDVLRRIPTLPPACRAPIRGTNALQNYDVFVSTFAAHYPFFNERGVDWPRVVAASRERVALGADLFTTLRDLVLPLNDGHVSIDAGKRVFDPQRIEAPGTPARDTAWSWAALRSSLRDYLQGPTTPLAAPMKFAGNRRVLHGTLAGDIGYLAILAEGGWQEGQTEDTPAIEHAAVAANVLDSIITGWGPLRGVVVDLRVNSGGFDAVALEIASRFTRTVHVAYRKSVKRADGESAAYDVVVQPTARQQVTAPVAVLIGPNTVSAGETIALAFAAQPHARLFGQPTRGILSDAIPKTLPNGWSYTLSMEVTRLPDGTLVEHRGVIPQERSSAPATPSADMLLGRDLQRAIAWLAR
jgi:carboxyl-terminal processing protease